MTMHSLCGSVVALIAVVALGGCNRSNNTEAEAARAEIESLKAELAQAKADAAAARAELQSVKVGTAISRAETKSPVARRSDPGEAPTSSSTFPGEAILRDGKRKSFSDICGVEFLSGAPLTRRPGELILRTRTGEEDIRELRVPLRSLKSIRFGSKTQVVGNSGGWVTVELTSNSGKSQSHPCLAFIDVAWVGEPGITRYELINPSELWGATLHIGPER